jgi:putative cell wall-binding protein
MGGLNIGAKYNFNAIKGHTKLVDPNYQPPIRPTYIKEPKPKLERFGELQFMASVGTVETEPGEAKNLYWRARYNSASKKVLTSTIAVDYAYKVAHRLKLHAVWMPSSMARSRIIFQTRTTGCNIGAKVYGRLPCRFPVPYRTL